MMNDNFTREIKFFPAWDKRNSDPKKDYGISGAELCFYLRGEKGVVQFKVALNWMLPNNRNGIYINNKYPFEYWPKPLPIDLGYHSPIPIYEDQTKISESCELLNNQPCYYDSSSLNAEPIFELLIAEGDEAVWEELKKYYKEIFNDE